MTDQEKTELRALVFKAWETTAPCPDGVNEFAFCPSCFFETFFKLLTETSQSND